MLSDDKFFLSIILGLAALIIFGIVGSCTHYSKLKTECMADGFKEYECYSMLKTVRVR